MRMTVLRIYNDTNIRSPNYHSNFEEYNCALCRMGGCAAPFCNNSSKKGYIMKVFPRDPQRRALWERNIPRENWTATNSSCLCEVHFAPEMWEHRRDGKRKLKLGAIPTLFGFFVKKDTDVSRNKEASKEPVKEQKSINNVLQPSIEDLECDATKNTAECVTVNVIPECNTESNIVDAVDASTLENNEMIQEECVTVNVIPECNTESSIVDAVDAFTLENNEMIQEECVTVNVIPECNTESNIVDAVDASTIENNETIQEECVTVLTTSTSDTCTCTSESEKLNEKEEEKCEEMIKKQRWDIVRMRKKLKMLKYLKQSLQYKIKNDKYMKALRRIFNEDQIAALCTKSQRGRNWSNETLQRAVKLKLVCGTSGYEEILRQGYPFPSLRTLRRRLEEFKREFDISKKMIASSTREESYFHEDTDTEDDEASHRRYNISK